MSHSLFNLAIILASLLRDLPMEVQQLLLHRREKNDAVVRMTLPENGNIFASEYSLYLPDKKLLQKSCKSGSKKKRKAKINEAAIPVSGRSKGHF